MRKVKGSITIEAAIIVPTILWLFTIVITILFYYHDKNVIIVLAHEAAVVGYKSEETKTDEIEAYFQKEVSHKLLLFDKVSVAATITGEQIKISCKAKKDSMFLQEECEISKTKPEEFVRNLLWMEKMKNEYILQK